MLESDQARAPFAPLLQPMLGALAAVLQAGHELEAREIVTTLSEVAENAVDFFRSGLVSAAAWTLTRDPSNPPPRACCGGPSQTFRLPRASRLPPVLAGRRLRRHASDHLDRRA